MAGEFLRRFGGKGLPRAMRGLVDALDDAAGVASVLEFNNDQIATHASDGRTPLFLERPSDYTVLCLLPYPSGDAGWVARHDDYRGHRFTDADVTLDPTNTITITAHGHTTGDGPYQFPTIDTALPTGLSVSTDYYIIRVDDNTIKLATSAANAEAGTAVSLTVKNATPKTFAPEDISGDTITVTGHGFQRGSNAIFSSSGTKPTGTATGDSPNFDLGERYWIRVFSADTFKVYYRPYGALVNTSYDYTFSDGGSGTHTVTRYHNLGTPESWAIVCDTVGWASPTDPFDRFGITFDHGAFPILPVDQNGNALFKMPIRLYVPENITLFSWNYKYDFLTYWWI